LIETTKQILQILSGKDKKNISLAVSLLLIKTVLDVLSVGLIVPILHFASNKNEKSFLNEYIPFLDQLNNIQLVVFFVSIFIFVYLIKTLFIVFYNSWGARLMHNMAANLSRKVLQKYLKNDYIFFLENNSAYIIRDINSETTVFALGFIGNIIQSVTQIVFILSICLFLIFYNIYSLYVILILVSLNALIVFITNKKFKKWGEIRLHAGAIFLKKLNEVIGGIKEVILYNKKDKAVDEVHGQMKKLAKANVYRDATSGLTAPVIEFAGILIFFSFFLILLIYSSLDVNEIIVLFGVFAFAAIKLLPAIIALVKSIQAIRFNMASCGVIYKILNKPQNLNNISETLEIKKLSLKSLNFENVSFTYNSQKEPTLSNLTFDLNRGDKIAIIGETGSGKTTLLNLISSLIAPSSGKIKINNFNQLNFSQNIRNHVGYVSQSVYLSDESILFNIALANDVSKEEEKKIILILETLNLDFINNQKIDIYSSLGERGAKLSGGQIQRIGIARALYRNPDILILDEATNALDELTEKKILDYLFKKLENKIIILCTHKKKLLEYCNKIIEVKNNKINIKIN
jgi:ABC-type multidrug transport system fused ATPase/permease subunit